MFYLIITIIILLLTVLILGFPDGYSSDIVYRYQENYTVPQGKTLYITSIYGSWYCLNLSLGYNLSDRVDKHPILLPEGAEISFENAVEMIIL